MKGEERIGGVLPGGKLHHVLDLNNGVESKKGSERKRETEKERMRATEKEKERKRNKER